MLKQIFTDLYGKAANEKRRDANRLIRFRTSKKGRTRKKWLAYEEPFIEGRIPLHEYSYYEAAPSLATWTAK